MPANQIQEPYERIDITTAFGIYETEDIAVIDVREPDEYNQAHIKNAILIPVDEIMARIEELPSDKKLLFVCASGYRSGLACEMAAAMGVDTTKLFNVDGGTQGWIENGHPTNSGPNP